jgi:hypothetical protein
MIVTTEFNVGEKVWVVDRNGYKVECPTCGGHEKVRRIDVPSGKFSDEVTCGHCEGTGKTYAGKLRWEPEEAVITDVGFYTGNARGNTGEPYITYYISQHMSSGSKSDKDVFLTREQAQLVCDKRNREDEDKDKRRGG